MRTSEFRFRHRRSSKGTTGIIEFMINDFSTFKEQVAKRSAELDINLVAPDHLLSEPGI